MKLTQIQQQRKKYLCHQEQGTITAQHIPHIIKPNLTWLSTWNSPEQIRWTEEKGATRIII